MGRGIAPVLLYSGDEGATMFVGMESGQAKVVRCSFLTPRDASYYAYEPTGVLVQRFQGYITGFQEDDNWLNAYFPCLWRQSL